jgi:hypothetical protein
MTPSPDQFEKAVEAAISAYLVTERAIPEAIDAGCDLSELPDSLSVAIKAARSHLQSVQTGGEGLRELLAAIDRCKNAIGHMDQDMSELVFDRAEMQRFNDLYRLADRISTQPASTEGWVKRKAQALLDALDTAEKLAAGGESQEANVNRVLTAAAHDLRAALAASTEGDLRERFDNLQLEVLLFLDGLHTNKSLAEKRLRAAALSTQEES